MLIASKEVKNMFGDVLGEKMRGALRKTTEDKAKRRMLILQPNNDEQMYPSMENLDSRDIGDADFEKSEE